MKRSGFCLVAAALGSAALGMMPLKAQAQTYSQGYSQPNMGGGFIEFLFGGAQAPSQQFPEPGRRRAPGYDEPGSYYDDRGHPPMIQRSAPPHLQVHGADGGDAYAQRRIDPRFMKQVVPYSGNEAPGTIIVDTPSRFLFLVQEDGKALRYGIGVGRPGFTWAGVKSVTRKAEWPDWVPPKEMLARQPHLPRHMAGGPDNPLGARALYLGSSLYRIHGSNEPWTIGQAVSSGCIRMRNDDVIDLYGRVKVGTRVVVI
jgi:lipoprotein-anchoring transpeptidase ErfK/SrfK